MIERVRRECSVKWRRPRNEGAARHGWSLWRERPQDLRYGGREVLSAWRYEGTYRVYFNLSPGRPKEEQAGFRTLFEAQVAVERFYAKHPEEVRPAWGSNWTKERRDDD